MDSGPTQKAAGYFERQNCTRSEDKTVGFKFRCLVNDHISNDQTITSYLRVNEGSENS